MSNNNKTKIYLASPFFNDKEISYMEQVRDILRDKGLDVFVPMEHQNPQFEFGSMDWRKATFKGDVDGIENCDVLVVILDGNYMDSGSAYEVGMAYQMSKKIVVVNPEGKSVNLMIAQSLHAIVDIEGLKAYDFDKMEVIPYTEYVW